MAQSIDSLSITITASCKSAITAVNNLTRSLNSLSSAISTIDSGKIDSLSNSLSKISNGLLGITSQSDAVKVMKDLASALDSVSKKASTISDVANKMSEISRATQGVTTEITTMSQNMGQALNSQSIAGEAVNSFELVRSAVGKVTEVVNNLKSQASNIEFNPSVNGLVVCYVTIEKIIDRIEKMKELLGDSMSGGIGIEQKDMLPQSFDSFIDKIQQAQGLIDDLRANMNRGIEGEILDPNIIDGTCREVEEAISDFQRLRLEQKNLAEEGSNPKLFASVFDALKNISTEGLEKLKSALKSVLSLLGRIGNVVGSVGSKIGKAFLNATGATKMYSSHLERAKKKSNGLVSGVININLAAKKTLKTIQRLWKMFRLMITRKIMQAIIKNAITGFNNVAQYSDKFNASISLLWNSLRQAGNAIGAMTTPLLNTFAPAINKVIQLLIEAINWLNQFFSALTGASSWIKAKGLSDSYAESLDNAGKSAKKLNKQLQGFDALNNLTTSDADSGTDIADMFEEVEVDNKIKDFADKMKELWNDILDPLKKAWNNVGSFVVDAFKNTAKKLKNLFKKIGQDWLSVWKESKTQDLIEKILITFGRIVNIVGILADKINKAWSYNNNGIKSIRAIRDALYVVVDWIQKAVEVTESWAKFLNLRPLFTSITNYLQSVVGVVDKVAGVIYDFYTMVLLPLSKWTLEKGLPQFVDVMAEFNTRVDWSGIKESLKEVWKALEPLGEKIGQGLIDFFGFLMGKLTEFLNSDLLKTIISSIADFADFLNNLDLDVDLSILNESFTGFLESLEPVVKNVEQALEDFVTYALKPIAEWTINKGLPELLQIFTDFNNKVDWNKLLNNLSKLWEHLEPFAEKVGEGLLIFIRDVSEALANFVNSEAFENFLTKIEDWMDKVDAEGVAKGLEKLCAAIIGFELAKAGFKVFSSIISAITFISANAGLISGIAVLTSLSTVIATLATDIKKYKEAIGKDNLWDALFKGDKAKKQEYAKSKGANNPYGDGSFTDSIDKAKDKLKDLNEQYDNGTISMKDYVKEIGGVISEYSYTSTCFAILGNTIDSFINKIKTIDLSSWFENNVKPWLSKEKWSKELSNIKESFSVKWKEVEDWWNNTAVVKWFNTKVKPLFSKEKWSFSGIKEGLTDMFSGAFEAIKESWNKFAKWLNEKLTIKIDTSTLIGKGISEIVGKSELKLANLPTFSTGGFPENGLFMANSSEMVGKFSNGKTAVANNEQIIDGIARGVASAESEQNALLRQQNALLQAILEKDTGISADGLFRSVQTSASNYYKRTGRYAFD